MAFKKNRRSPFAAVIVMAAGLALTGGGYAAATAAVEAVKPVSAVASADEISEGKKLFLANCASCHGTNAEGTKNAPSLIGVGAASVEFQVATGRMPGQASGPQLEKKPVQFTEEQINQMAAYVATLGDGPAIPTDEMVLADGDVSRGGELFRINCAMCHNAVGAGGALTEGKYAPALEGCDRASHLLSDVDRSAEHASVQRCKPFSGRQERHHLLLEVRGTKPICWWL